MKAKVRVILERLPDSRYCLDLTFDDSMQKGYYFDSPPERDAIEALAKQYYLEVYNYEPIILLEFA